MHEVGVVSGPGVVHEVHDAVGLAGDLRTPRVEAQEDVRVLRTSPLEERDNASDLLVGIDDLTLLAGPDTAHVDEVGAELQRVDESRLGRLEIGVPVAAEEGVTSPVDDRHDRWRGAVETLAAQDERP